MPLSPPLVPFPSFDNGGPWDSVFLEHAYWPLSHFIVPACAYVFIRSKVFVFALVMLWEVVEAVQSGAFGQYVLFDGDTQIETTLDSLFGDPWMGVHGITTMWLLLKTFDLDDGTIFFPYHQFDWRNYWRDYVRATIELALIALPTFWLARYVGHSHHLSLGYILFSVLAPTLIVVYGMVNERQPLFRELSTPLGTRFEKSSDVADRMKLHLVWATFVAVFLWSASIHWTNIWMQTFFHALFIDLVLVLVLIYRKLNNKQSP